MIAWGLETPLLGEDEEPIFPEEPYETQVLYELQHFNSLPWSGGMQDQPKQVMDCLKILLQVETEIRRIRTIREAQEDTDVARP